MPFNRLTTVLYDLQISKSISFRLSRFRVPSCVRINLDHTTLPYFRGLKTCTYTLLPCLHHVTSAVLISYYKSESKSIPSGSRISVEHLRRDRLGGGRLCALCVTRYINKLNSPFHWSRTGQGLSRGTHQML